MAKLEVTIDVLPPHCSIEFVFSGPIVCAVARNIDTNVTGPLVSVDRETRALRWADLDPDRTVAASTP